MLHGLRRLDKVPRTRRLENQSSGILAVSSSGAALLVVLVKQLVDRLLLSELLLLFNTREHVTRVQKTGVNFMRREVLTTDNENFCRDVTGGGRLGGLDLLEELLERPKKRCVIVGAENLGHEGTSTLEVFTSKFESVYGKLVLHEGILAVFGTNVGGTVTKHNISLVATHLLTNLLTACIRGNILLENSTSSNGLDGQQINTNNLTLGALRNTLGQNLKPTSRSGTEINHTGCVLEQIILAVQLDDLKTRTSSVSLLLRELVVLIINGLLLARHLGPLFLDLRNQPISELSLGRIPATDPKSRRT
mmetsp:Transcript_18216/g.35785  ORF Transcript_18216/g.35785 Transcript_18216/m.35785 type:complete len:306 (-) Transcript_18216:133-1050(-)